MLCLLFFFCWNCSILFLVIIDVFFVFVFIYVIWLGFWKTREDEATNDCWEDIFTAKCQSWVCSYHIKSYSTKTFSALLYTCWGSSDLGTVYGISLICGERAKNILKLSLCGAWLLIYNTGYKIIIFAYVVLRTMQLCGTGSKKENFLLSSL